MPEREGERVRDRALDGAAAAIEHAHGLLVTAGAGMGVDSGLPDFRGTEGFWRAYPPFARLGLRFEQVATPRHFHEDPALAWGFYGHRLGLYRATEPHEGFHTLRRWGELVPAGAFVFTSNVDGHFQRAGFGADRVVECHGSLLHLQCARPCCDEVWDAGEQAIPIDPETFRAEGPLPACPACGAVARPNVLMFGDWAWLPRRTEEQEAKLRAWLDEVRRESGPDGGLVIVELGAGTAVPTVRLASEHLAKPRGATLIRINPREPECPPGGISLAAGALDALREIDHRLSGRVGEPRALDA